MDWFKTQSTRDQLALVVGGIALVIYILVGMIYQPMLSRVSDLEVRNQAVSADLKWMVQSAAQVKALAGKNSRNVSTKQGSISQVVNNSVRQAGLKMKRFQPNGDKQAQVWLEGVPYAAAIGWLNDIENRFGFTIDSASINASSQAGMINLRVRLSNQ